MENPATDLVLAEPEARLLRVDVLRELRQDILSCRIAPGTELTEAGLAERFAISKSPVRDALARLVQEGLVKVVPRRGYRVMPISLNDVTDMFEYRAVLESASARIAASSAETEALRALDRFRVHDERTYADGFASYNRAFHQALAHLSGNGRLAAAQTSLIDQMDRVVTMSVRAMRGHDPARVVDEHCHIIDALQRRDGRRAGALLSRHVLQACKRVRDALSHAAIVE